MENTDERYNSFKQLNKGKKIAIIYGNCHTTAIRQVLEKSDVFNGEYAFFPIKAIQEVKDPEYFKGLFFSDCDLFIHQSIQKNNRYGEAFSSNRIMSGLKDKAEVLAIPNIYHLPMCYFPQYKEGKELKNKYGHTVFFRDVIVDTGIANNESIDEIVEKYLANDFFSEQYMESLYETYISKVKKREDEWDVKIADFLIDQRNKNLFYDPNHPREIVIEYICKSIMEKLGFKGCSLDMNQMKPLDDHEMPLCKDVIDFFGIELNEKEYKIRKSGNKLLRGEMYLKEYVDQYMSLLWQDSSYGKIIQRKSRKKYIYYNFVNVARRIRGVRYYDKQ